MTDSQRKRPIVAVFGGTSHNQAHQFAEFVGEELAGLGALVLAGGVGALLPLGTAKPGAKRPVKETAIVGAENAVVPLRHRWIGVDQSNGPDDDVFECGFIIRTDLGHARNFVEAHLCDAAIVLPGEEGTRSEATFALALGKPVLLVGNEWTATYPIEEPRAIPGIIKDARKRVDANRVADPWLKQQLDAAVLEAALQTLPEFDRLCLPRTVTHQMEIASVAARWILGFLGSSRGGSFPPLNGYAAVATKYGQWLTEADKEIEGLPVDPLPAAA